MSVEYKVVLNALNVYILTGLVSQTFEDLYTYCSSLFIPFSTSPFTKLLARFYIVAMVSPCSLTFEL